MSEQDFDWQTDQKNVGHYLSSHDTPTFQGW